MDCPSILRVSTVPTSEMKIHLNDDGSVKLLGIQGRFLGTVLEALKMPFKLEIAEDGEWGRLLSNGNFTGMIGKIQKGAADIAESSIGITEQRSTVVDFSAVYWTDDLTFVIKKPGPEAAYLAFVHPFDFTTWIFILTAVMVMPLIFRYFLCHKGNYILIFLRLLGSIFGQSTLAKYDTNGSKTLIFSWRFFATVISFSYSAVLLSMFSIPSEIMAVKNFKELSNAVENNGYKCYVTKGTAQLDFMLNSDKDYLKYLAKSIILHSWYSTNRPLLLTEQIDYRSAVIERRNSFISAGPEEWKPHFLSDDSLTTYKFAIPMRKNFCYKKKLNTIISRINSAGLYSQYLKEEHFKAWLSASEKRRDVSKKRKTLSLEDLFGAFGVLLVGLHLGIIAFICEFACHRIKKKRI